MLLRPAAVDRRGRPVRSLSEKERDCWVSLISTPLEAGQIVKAKILGSLWSLRGLVPFLAVVWLPALLLRPEYFFGIAFSLLDLGILAAFTAALGVYCSLSSKSTLRAMGAALGIAIVVGGGYLLCCCPVLAIGGARDGGGRRNAPGPCALHAVSVGLAGLCQPPARLDDEQLPGRRVSGVAWQPT